MAKAVLETSRVSTDTEATYSNNSPVQSHG